MKHETPEYEDEQPKKITDWAFIIRFINLVTILFIFTLGFTGG